MKFANILLETNPRSVTYPALYCRSDQPVVFDEQLGEWEMYNAGMFDFSTYFNSLSVMKLKRYTRAKGFSLHLDIDRDFRGVCTQIDLIIRKRLQDPLSHLR